HRFDTQPSTINHQLLFNSFNQLFRLAFEINCKRILRRSRFFEICKLTGEKLRIEKMSSPGFELLGNSCATSAQKNKFHFRAYLQLIAILFLQRRASQDSV